MDQPSRFQDLTITVKKIRIGHTMFGPFVLDLRIRKSDPDLIHLVRIKAVIDQLDLCPEESHIWQILFQGRFCASPESCTLDVDPDKVLSRKFPRQVYRVLPFTTAKFDHYGVIILKKGYAPLSSQGKSTGQDLIPFWLDHVLEGFILCKSFEFVLTPHRLLLLKFWVKLRKYPRLSLILKFVYNLPE